MGPPPPQHALLHELKLGDWYAKHLCERSLELFQRPAPVEHNGTCGQRIFGCGGVATMRLVRLDPGVKPQPISSHPPSRTAFWNLAVQEVVLDRHLIQHLVEPGYDAGL